jgi:hypothetical protein
MLTQNLYLYAMVQEIIVAIVLAVSVLFLLRVIWNKFFKKENNCDSCAMGKMVNESSQK